MEAMEDPVMLILEKWKIEQQKNKQKVGWRAWKNMWNKKKKSKEEVQVHPIIPWELSAAFQIAKPYRPSMMVELETISEAAEEGLLTPFCEIPNCSSTPSLARTPLYFVGGKRRSRRFRVQRFVKLLWKVHSSKIRSRVSSLVRSFMPKSSMDNDNKDSLAVSNSYV